MKQMLLLQLALNGSCLYGRYIEMQPLRQRCPEDLSVCNVLLDLSRLSSVELGDGKVISTHVKQSHLFNTPKTISIIFGAEPLKASMSLGAR